MCQGSGCRLDTAKGCYWGVHRVTVQQLWCIETGNRVAGISMREMLGASLKMTHHANGLLYIAFWWNLETLRFCLSVCLSNICFLNIFITWFKTFRITSLQHITHSRRLSPLYIIKCFGKSVVNVVHCLIWSFLHSIILTKELHTSLAQNWHQWLTFF